MNESGNSIEGVIFDLDGTLADTKLDFAAMCEQLQVPASTPLLEHIEGLTDRRQSEIARDLLEQHEMSGAACAEWMPGAQQMLERLHAANMPMGIVTRNMRAAAMLTIERLGIPIDVVITREDCQPKPHPEGLLKISSHWSIAAENIAYVGDYKFDLLAANSANMLACLIANGRNAKFAALADWVITDFCEFTERVLARESI
ncbi:HAD-IA family hydrolase [Exilibacterium tricleocarpae]|uniref:HAD-IA family hydrolase n=1 Tax=Exilibacterium tricleocarpae TaxID=2591008 RepID=A0A545T5W8_9GAMM|nr:HAD-IA family hydrolase [Exilibacterium tricleocarpae]TQV72614.1 HAD-IA family hydrolase [Exilibacterium tricleocarpae]